MFCVSKQSSYSRFARLYRHLILITEGFKVNPVVLRNFHKNSDAQLFHANRKSLIFK